MLRLLVVTSMLLLGSCSRQDTFGTGYDECIIKNLTSQSVETQARNEELLTATCRNRFLVHGDVRLKLLEKWNLEDNLTNSAIREWNRAENYEMRGDIWININSIIFSKFRANKEVEIVVLYASRNGVLQEYPAIESILPNKSRKVVDPFSDPAISDKVGAVRSDNVMIYAFARPKLDKLAYRVRIEISRNNNSNNSNERGWETAIRSVTKSGKPISETDFVVPIQAGDPIVVALVMPQLELSDKKIVVSASAIDYLKN